MLKDHIYNVFKQHLVFEPTQSQLNVLKTLGEFLSSENDMSIYLLKGYAGTGKTSLINILVNSFNELRLRSHLMAPTGRASKVLSQLTKHKATTIHRKIYRQQSSSDGFGKFELDNNLHKHTIFIVDEASMIGSASADQSFFGSGNLLHDLLEYVYSGVNCKLVLVGDVAQLPPVGLVISPALDKSVLEDLMFVVNEGLLPEVVRQSKDSGILYNATHLREKLTEKQTSNYPKFKLSGFEDVLKIDGSMLIEELNDSYSTAGREETIIICRSNKRAYKYNQGIRQAVFAYEDEITTGDLLMIVKNNYFWLKDNEATNGFIANGDIVEITRINSFEEVHGFRFADITVQFLDYADIEVDVKIILDCLTSEGAALSSEDNNRLFNAVSEDYMDIASKRERYKRIREDKYFNALQVKFAYAVTCHKAQGGQWENVFIDQGYFVDDMLNVEFYRWLYTAVTRTTQKLYLVNFKDDFFYADEIE